MAAFSAFFPPKANSRKGVREKRSPRLSGVCGGPRPASLLHGFPTVVTLPLASLSMHPTAIICISADRTYARSAKGGQILLSNSGMRYRAKGMDGRTTDGVREKRNKKKSGKCRGMKERSKIMRNVMGGGRISPGGCFGCIAFFFIFSSWSGFGFVWTWRISVVCNFDKRMMEHFVGKIIMILPMLRSILIIEEF